MDHSDVTNAAQDWLDQTGITASLQEVIKQKKEVAGRASFLRHKGKDPAKNGSYLTDFGTLTGMEIILRILLTKWMEGEEMERPWDLVIQIYDRAIALVTAPPSSNS